MGEVSKLLLAVFGGILFLAIVSVIVGRNSKAPQAIASLSNGLAKVVAAAVQPVNTAGQNGNNGTSTYTTPGWSDSLSRIMRGPLVVGDI